MAEKKKNIAKTVMEAVAPAIEQAGYVLWDVQTYREGVEQVLCVTIDKNDKTPVSTEDCAAVTKAIDPILDELDPFENSYCLEVSSAGDERAITEDKHFDYVISNALPVTIGFFAPVDGKKELGGAVIASFDRDNITLSDGRVIERKTISKINTEYSEQPIKE